MADQVRRVLVRATATATAAAVAIGSGAVAAKPPKPESSTVHIDSLSHPNHFTAITGWVEANKPVCVSGRKVKVSVVPTDGKAWVFDVAKTGRNGGWTALHDSADAMDHGPFKKIAAKLLAAKRVSKGRTIACSGDSFVLTGA